MDAVTATLPLHLDEEFFYSCYLLQVARHASASLWLGDCSVVEVLLPTLCIYVLQG